MAIRRKIDWQGLLCPGIVPDRRRKRDIAPCSQKKKKKKKKKNKFIKKKNKEKNTKQKVNI